MRADWTAEKNGVSRAEQDRFAAQSHQRAAKATAEGWFKDEIVPLSGAQVGNRRVPGPEGGVSADEGIRGDSTAEGWPSSVRRSARRAASRRATPARSPTVPRRCAS